MSDQPVPSLKCATCGQSLCTRKQTLNLALGILEEMKCLDCLAAIEQSSAPELLEGTIGYILGRDCFRKQWHNYTKIADCPDRVGCHPSVCFSEDVKNDGA